MSRVSFFTLLLLSWLLGLGCATSDEAATGADDAAQQSTAAVEQGPRLTKESLQLQIDSFDQVWDTVRTRHWDEDLGGADWEGARKELRPRIEEVRSQREARAIMNDLLGRLGQSHFAVFPGKNDEEAFEEDAEKKVETTANATGAEDKPKEGRSITLSGDGNPGFGVHVVDDEFFVTEVQPSSAAATEGVRVGWRILKARGIDLAIRIENLKKDNGGEASPALINAVLAETISGRPGDVVSYVFRTTNGRKIESKVRQLPPRGREFELTEDAVLRVWWEKRRLSNGVGYVAFNAFGDPDGLIGFFNDTMTEFQDAPGIVLDIRGNPGGIGSLASTISGFFVGEKGKNMGHMLHREGKIAFPIFPRAKVYGGPVAILIDGQSGSTAEIFAAGLQDLGRAKVFGSTTAGAVLPAQIVTLPNGDGFIFATADFLSPKGRRLEGQGASPDVEVARTRESLLVGRDAPLEAAAAWLVTDEARREAARWKAEEESVAKAEKAKVEAEESGSTKTDNGPAADASLPAGSELVARFIKATGGESAYRNVKSLKITGEIFLGQMLGKRPMNLLLSMNGDAEGPRYVAGVDLGSFGIVREGSDGSVVWESSAIMGSRILDGTERAVKLRHTNPLSVVDWRKYFSALKTTKEVEIEGLGQAYEVHAIPKAGKPEVWWFSKDSGLLVQSRVVSDTPAGELTMTTTQEEWSDVGGGLLMPLKSTIKGGPEAQVVELKEVKTNIEIEDSPFALPKAIEDLREKDAEKPAGKKAA